MDPRQFFSMLFGGGKFEDWIGQVSLGQSDDSTHEAARLERAELLKVKLISRLEGFYRGLEADGSSEAKKKKSKESTAAIKARTETYKAEMKAIADELQEESYGRQLLRSIGGVYERKADIFFGKYGEQLHDAMRCNEMTMR
jgi:hypothetical protein